MTNKLNPFINEDKQQEILKRLLEVKNQYDLMKAEFNKPHEKKILDMIVGNKPIIQYLQSYKCKKKENGELLLGNTDLSAFIDALRESMPQQKAPLDNYVKTNKTTLSANKSEEQIINLLEQIANLQNAIEEIYIELVDLLSQEMKTDIKQSNN